jgi:phage gpG-like protein
MKTNFDLDKWASHFTAEQNEELIKQLKNIILDDLAQRFKIGGAGGTQWKKKKKITRAFEGGANKTLIYTGTLSKSFEYMYTAGQLIVYTKTPYAKVHNFGATFVTSRKQTYWMFTNVFKKKCGLPKTGFEIKIPKRTFMYFTDNLREKINLAVFAYFKKSEKMGK